MTTTFQLPSSKFDINQDGDFTPYDGRSLAFTPRHTGRIPTSTTSQHHIHPYRLLEQEPPRMLLIGSCRLKPLNFPLCATFGGRNYLRALLFLQFRRKMYLSSELEPPPSNPSNSSNANVTKDGIIRQNHQIKPRLI
ncbi:uncharacterized protein MELLADRAFT_101783 [Melampsora larici-populina 98AG31]|uniref:Uncharacterized protein n=1 Tax=Melampsora larici-populina (strain 98AG31 / pathotype 3-4-7) TaxID=747676 RepID=F4R6Y7_MELLP|nr:uncharacterized protein MELLADRAFT_101783 [Melampsora larici-populina 98AG31]EGG12373.1 hypothetical protein MELLADRAFT_101783 [Melampsora larici-populina 98AG31]